MELDLAEFFHYKKIFDAMCYEWSPEIQGSWSILNFIVVNLFTWDLM